MLYIYQWQQKDVKRRQKFTSLVYIGRNIGHFSGLFTDVVDFFGKNNDNIDGSK